MKSLPLSTIVLLFFIAAIPIGSVISIWAAPPIGGAYAQFFEPNDLGNNVDVSYLIGLSKKNGKWSLRTPVVNIGGS